MSTACPWDGWARVPPEWCEESLCAWVRQPGNTWSNVGFLIAGIAILRMAAKGRSPHLRGLGIVCVVTALGSAFYHASETFAGRVADYVGMYMGPRTCSPSTCHAGDAAAGRPCACSSG